MLALSYFLFVFLFSINDSKKHAHIFCWNDTALSGIYFQLDYKIIAVQSSELVELECRLCQDVYLELDESAVWTSIHLKKNRTATHQKSLPSSRKRITITKSNALMFSKPSPKQSGLYNCQHNSSSGVLTDISYFLDVRNENKTLTNNGSLTDWIKYRDTVVAPASTAVAKESLNNENGNVTFEWTNWGQCVCGITKFSSMRTRLGLCRLIVDDGSNETVTLPCRSPIAARMFPMFSQLIDKVTDFQQREPCFEECVPGLMENEVAKFKVEQKYFVDQGDDIAFKCPGYLLMRLSNATLNKTINTFSASKKTSSDVQWIKDYDFFLNRSRSAVDQDRTQNHIEIDTWGTLYLNEVQPDDAGNYSCLIGNVPIKQHAVHQIIEGSFLDGKRSLAFLAYVLGACFILYLILLGQRIKRLQLDADREPLI